MNTVAYIGLGSNQGDSRATLQSALTSLNQHTAIRVTDVSSFYQSKPVGPVGQPDYINAVACLSTSLNAQELLAILLETERLHGRVRDPNLRWGPRTLDLDLLLFGDAVIQEANLIVPHPELSKRSFVVYPLYELHPDLILPCGQALRNYTLVLASSDLTKLL